MGDASMDQARDYASFLLRFWIESKGDDNAAAPTWQAEVESIQTGDSWHFGNFDELMTFLEDATPDSGRVIGSAPR